MRRDAYAFMHLAFRRAAAPMFIWPEAPFSGPQAAPRPGVEGDFGGGAFRIIPVQSGLAPDMLSFRAMFGRDANARMQNGRFVMPQQLVAFRAGDEGGRRDVARHVQGRAAHIQRLSHNFKQQMQLFDNEKVKI